MGARCHHRSLLPPGLRIEHLEIGSTEIVAVARSQLTTSECPACGRASTRIHSRYRRCLSDLPAHGRLVRIDLEVRRFRCDGSCDGSSCQRKIFAERFADEITVPFARRTSRLRSIIHHLGLALGGRPGRSLARRLLLPVSKDTLLRAVRSHSAERLSTPHVVGIDDWAWKRGHRYGTIVCDLERRRIVDVLPHREASTVEAWLSVRPEIRVVSRDRGGGSPEHQSRCFRFCDKCESAPRLPPRFHRQEKELPNNRPRNRRLLSQFLCDVRYGRRRRGRGRSGWIAQGSAFLGIVDTKQAPASQPIMRA